MRLNFKLLGVLLATSVCALSTAHADSQNVFYFGAGAAKKTGAATQSSSPAALGFLRLSHTTDSVWGLDVSSEGTMLDSTWGQVNAARQATAFNILLGKNLNRTDNARLDAMLIAGIRETASSCPPSYLGYQCYADQKPETSYAFNGGLALTWTYKDFMFGARVTGESTQALVGFRF